MPGCVWSAFFWVDVTVANDAYDKNVVIEWSSDDWATAQEMLATYEETLADGRERWATDVKLEGLFSSGWAPWPMPEEIRVRAYVEMNGQRYSDPRTYYVYQKVDRNRPVRLLASEVSYTPDVGGQLRGRIRVFDLSYEKEVTVRLSTDDWQSWQDAPAWWSHEDEWHFAVDGLGGMGGTDRPERVDFAIRYDSGGQSYWDSTPLPGEFGGWPEDTAAPRNHSHRLRPTFVPAYVDYLPFGEAQTLSGILDLCRTASTDIAVARYEVRTDYGAWSEGACFSGSTIDLTPEPHRVDFKAVLEGGYETELTLPFNVENHFQPVDRWPLAYPHPDASSPSPDEAPWGAAIDDHGRMYVGWEGDYAAYDPERLRHVVRYHGFGQNSEAAPFAALAALPSESVDRHHIWTVTATPDGAVFGLAVTTAASSQMRPWARWASGRSTKTTEATAGIPSSTWHGATAASG